MSDREKEFLLLAVKLLFKRIEEGKIHFARERVPETMKALDAVEFDEQGMPVFETITGPVRALANAVIGMEMERIEEEIEERARSSPVHDYLVEAVEVTDNVLRKCAEEGRFSEVAFELYKEAGCILSVCAHCYLSEEPGEMVLTRNQAICAGLLVRINKFMITVVQLCSQADRGEVIMALNRCIAESAINLRFLARKNEGRFYDQFVRFSLAPEREFHDLVRRNIAERGGVELPIEARILDSIDSLCDASGVRIEDVGSKYRDWGKGVRARFDALGESDAYVLSQRIPSHAVHGTWVDLLQNHLEAKGEGFSPNPGWQKVDERLLGPVAIMVLDAAEDYLGVFFEDQPELRPLYARIDDLRHRILKLAAAHEEWLSAGEVQNREL